MGKMIYLATPYSHPDATVRRDRFEFVTKVAGWFMFEYVVFSPITHSHMVEEFWDHGKKSWNFWKMQDLEFIRRADEMFVLTLNGWDESEGVTAEINYCNEIGKNIRYIRPKHLPSTLVKEAMKRGLFDE